jgi:predicted acyl esterase
MTITKTLLFITSLASAAALAQQAPSSTGEYYRDYQPEAIIRELKRDAVSDDAIMIPMRDGVGLDTNVYRPKNAKGPLPTIFWKTPYNELEMKSGPALNYALAAVRRGYAFVVQNERGRYF